MAVLIPVTRASLNTFRKDEVWSRRKSGYPVGMDSSTFGSREEAAGFRPARSCAYEGWTVVELKKWARQLGLSGYSNLSKERLISLIRSV